MGCSEIEGVKMSYHKIIGDLFKTNVELSCDLSRWLIGFGWIKHGQNFGQIKSHEYKFIKRISIHCNLGPFAVVLTIV